MTSKEKVGHTPGPWASIRDYDGDHAIIRNHQDLLVAVTIGKREAMPNELTTTLADLRAANACQPRYDFLRAALGPTWGDRQPIPLTRILELNGLDDRLWALENVGGERGIKILRLSACDWAEHVLLIYEKEYPNDTRVRNCIETTRRFLRGEATAAELGAARGAAWDAAWAAARAASRRFRNRSRRSRS